MESNTIPGQGLHVQRYSYDIWRAVKMKLSVISTVVPKVVPGGFGGPVRSVEVCFFRNNSANYQHEGDFGVRRASCVLICVVIYE